jgi:hypothetical protein
MNNGYLWHGKEKLEGDSKIHTEVSKGTGKGPSTQSHGTLMGRRKMYMLTTLQKNVKKCTRKTDKHHS